MITEEKPFKGQLSVFAKKSFEEGSAEKVAA